MRRAALLAALLLSGCLSAPEQAMVNSCIADGSDPQVCECQRAETKAHMSEKSFKAVTLMAEKRDAEADAIINTMTENQQLAMANAMLAAVMKCAFDNAKP